jgi:hypothetical protein
VNRHALPVVAWHATRSYPANNSADDYATHAISSSGTPCWVSDRRDAGDGSAAERFNNHNWVEVWDGAAWSFMGAAEWVPEGYNRWDALCCTVLHSPSAWPAVLYAVLAFSGVTAASTTRMPAQNRAATCLVPGTIIAVLQLLHPIEPHTPDHAPAPRCDPACKRARLGHSPSVHVHHQLEPHKPTCTL